MLSIHIWGFLFIEANTDGEILEAARNFLTKADVDLDAHGTWAGQLMFLSKLASEEAEGVAKRLTVISEFQISIDRSKLAKE